MALAVLNTTTLSAALDKDDIRFSVAASANMTVGDMTTAASILVVGGEQMLLQRIPVANTIEVQRGHNGTEARAHLSGALVTIGSGTLLGRTTDGVTELIGDATAGYPNFQLPVGSYYTDRSTGFVYQMVSVATAVVAGEWVYISSAGAALQLTATAKGLVGICVEAAAASTYTWVLVAGTYASAMMVSDVTTAMELGAGTGVANPYDSDNAVLIHRASCSVAPSTATTPSLGQGLGTAWIDHPWVSGVATFVS
jgi:hypothetical protein